MRMIYTHQTPSGNVHVKIGFSKNDDYFFSGQVWDDKRELIDFGYKVISDSRKLEPAILPDTLPRNMTIAILVAVQRVLDAMV